MSMGELWGPWVPRAWQDMVLSTVRKAEQHTFLNLTKNPETLWCYVRSLHRNIGYGPKSLPPNLWLGVSIESPAEIDRLNYLRAVNHPNKFVSFEPLLGAVNPSHFAFEGIRWVIIGAQTGPGAKQPDIKWAGAIIRETVKAGIPVFLKDNLDWPEIFTHKPQEFPEELII